MANLDSLKSKMSPEMFREVHFLRTAEIYGTTEMEITRVKLDAGGYAPNGEYFGTCAPGERIYCVEYETGTRYIRTTATITQLRRALCAR